MRNLGSCGCCWMRLHAWSISRVADGRNRVNADHAEHADWLRLATDASIHRRAESLFRLPLVTSPAPSRALVHNMLGSLGGDSFQFTEPIRGLGVIRVLLFTLSRDRSVLPTDCLGFRARRLAGEA